MMSGHNWEMKPSAHVGRNEPCPCGSGRKYKVCCQRKEHEARRSSRRYILPGIVAAVIVALAGAAAYWSAPDEKTNTVAQSPTRAAPFPMAAASQTRPVLVPQPPGPVPEGKVWSPEHGHWHDVDPGYQVFATSPSSSPSAPNFVPAPQPPGPVPEGKVWSTEHGHWHDAPAAATVATGPTSDLTPTGLTPPAPTATGVTPIQVTTPQASAAPVVISTPTATVPAPAPTAK